MLAELLLGIAILASVLTSVYWICLIVGGGLVLLSLLGGEGADTDAADVDFDFDADLDAGDALDADLDVEAGDMLHHADSLMGLSTWFSTRFLVYLVASFGAFGVVFTHLTAIPVWVSFGIALVGGLIVGQMVHHVFRAIKRTSGNSATRPADYVNKLARVTIAIAPARKGEIALQVRSGERFVPAMASGAKQEFAKGDQVVVVSYRAGVAQVVARSEYEQKTGSR